jgi:hypothetical protein
VPVDEMVSKFNLLAQSNRVLIVNGPTSNFTISY